MHTEVTTIFAKPVDSTVTEFIGSWAVIDLETPRRTDLHHIGALDRPGLLQ